MESLYVSLAIGSIGFSIVYIMSAILVIRTLNKQQQEIDRLAEERRG